MSNAIFVAYPLDTAGSEAGVSSSFAANRTRSASARCNGSCRRSQTVDLALVRLCRVDPGNFTLSPSQIRT
jgi:hypothetical protein